MRTIPTTHRYSTAFWNAMRGRQFDSVDLNERRGYNGAVIIPTAAEEILSEELLKHNIFRQIAAVIQTDSMAYTIAALAPIGNAAFVPDGATIPESSGDYVGMELQSHKIAQIVKLTNKLIGDAGFDLQDALMKELGRTFGAAEENACINGNGVYEPYGILHPQYGAETGVTSKEPGKLTVDDVYALYYSLDRKYRRDAVWLMNDETALHLRTLKDSVGNYLWRSPDDTIFSRPVMLTPYMPDIAAGATPVALGAFSFYWLVERGGAMIEPLREKYAIAGQTGYLCVEHIDARLTRRDAIKTVLIG